MAAITLNKGQNGGPIPFIRERDCRSELPLFRGQDGGSQRYRLNTEKKGKNSGKGVKTMTVYDCQRFWRRNAEKGGRSAETEEDR